MLARIGFDALRDTGRDARHRQRFRGHGNTVVQLRPRAQTSRLIASGTLSVSFFPSLCYTLRVCVCRCLNRRLATLKSARPGCGPACRACSWAHRWPAKSRHPRVSTENQTSQSPTSYVVVHSVSEAIKIVTLQASCGSCQQCRLHVLFPTVIGIGQR